MSEIAEKYNGQPRHSPDLQRQTVELAKTLAAQSNDDLFALFCAVYYTCQGESAEVRHRLRRLAELIASHPDKRVLWSGFEEEYRTAAAKGVG